MKGRISLGLAALFGLALLFWTRGAHAQMELYVDDSQVPPEVKPGDEVTLSVVLNLDIYDLKSYKMNISYDRDALILTRVRQGSDPEFSAPLSRDVPYYQYMDLWEESNQSQGCKTSGVVTLAYLTFKVRLDAPLNHDAVVSVSAVPELKNCQNEDISRNLPPPEKWGQGHVYLPPLPAGAYGSEKFMDMDGDATPTEIDAELLRKIVDKDVTAADADTLLAINARQCDINGNAITDPYDAGRFDALIRPARLIHAGPDGLCDTTAQGDDLQAIPAGQGEPNGVVIRPGFNYLLDSTPGGDDVVSGNKIIAGPNGIAESAASGDDLQAIPVGQGEPGAACVLPGANQVIDSTPAGDDVAVEDQKNFQDFITKTEQPGIPDRLVRVSPLQEPLILDQTLPVPLTVSVVDKQGRPKTGLSPVFKVVQGSGYFDDGAGGTTTITNLESDYFADKAGIPRGQVTAIFRPALGTNRVEVSLPGDPAKGIPDLGPLVFTVEVLEQGVVQPDLITITAERRSMFVGDTVGIKIVVTKNGVGVHGLASRLIPFTKRGLSKGVDATYFGQERFQSVFIDQFETGDLSGGPYGPWSYDSGGGSIGVTQEVSGYFGIHSVQMTAAAGQRPKLWRKISTPSYKDLQIAFQYAFIGDPVSYNPVFLVEYSLDGTNWFTLNKYYTDEELGMGLGVWLSDKINLKGLENINDGAFFIRFTLDGADALSPQVLYLDNVSVAGLKILLDEDFESYNEGDFPTSLTPGIYLVTGPNGILETTPQGDDVNLFPVGNGEPYSTIIYPGPNNVLDSLTAGDDREGAGQTINSGANGIAESAAAGDDFQEIPVGEGKPWTHGIYPGFNNILDSLPQGDDQKVGEMGPAPRIAVDTSVGDSIGPGQGNLGSDKFLFIGRAAAGPLVQNYTVAAKVNLEGMDQVVLTFYSRTLHQADPADMTRGKDFQEFVVEVSDNGGKSWVKVWDFAGQEETSWTKHEILLHDDPRFQLVDDFLIRWRASMDSTEDDLLDPDGVFIDDILITGIEEPTEEFGPVIDTMDGNGTYRTYMYSVVPANTVNITAAYWPPVVDPLSGQVPLFADPPATVAVNIRKAEFGSIQVLPSTFTLKACKSMNVKVIGRFTDTPPGKVEDMTRLFKLLVNGPARETSPGVITADCFLGDTVKPIRISAIPKVPGLYDPGGSGSGQQTGDVSGKIYKPNYQGAANAPVWIDTGSSKIYGHADSNGFHFFADVPAGSGYTIASSLQGYTKNYRTINVTAGGNTSVSFVLLSGQNFDGDSDDDDLDTDDDNDGAPDSQEATAGSSAYDPDTDGDGYTDDVDAFPGNSAEWADNDNDGIGDNADTDDDNDGISDSEEEIPGTDGYITDPKDPDSDGGGENDGSEVAGGRNPTDSSDDVTTADTDGDGLLDSDEVSWGTSVSNPDTDGDGLCDGDTSVAPTCSAGEDMDKDGVVDSGETDPKKADTDDDGLPDNIEVGYCADAKNYDTDGDGLCDGDTSVYDGSTLLCSAGEDMDKDGMVDSGETDPCDDDTDNDGMNDGYEKSNGLDPLTDDASGDPDSDSLTNIAESAKGTYANDSDSDNDTMPDGWEVTYESCGLNPLAADGSADPDSDNETNAKEYAIGASPCDPDSDDDGLCDGDTAVYDGSTLVCSAGEDMDLDGVVDSNETNPADSDSDDDGLTDGQEKNTYSTNPLNPDTDNDTMPDGWEVSHASCGLDPLTGDSTNDPDSDQLVNAREYDLNADACSPDTDGDGLCDGNTLVMNGSTVLCSAGEDMDLDGVVDAAETDPTKADTDGDGLNDKDEGTQSTNPRDWDSDDDFIPDGYEVQHMSSSPPLDPLDPSDGNSDFESSGFEDGMPNYHEYWNGTDPWTKDPAPGTFANPGCYYWADANGDGTVSSSDSNMLALTIISGTANYENVIPPNGDSMDLNADGYLTSADMVTVNLFITGGSVGQVAGRPASLEVDYAPGSTVSVGSTTHVTLQVRNNASSGRLYSSGFGVVFWIDTSLSTGSATLLGGEGTQYGGQSGNRYDFSGASAQGGKATIVLKIESAGDIVLKAKIPACGTSGQGRWVDEILLSSPITIHAQ